MLAWTNSTTGGVQQALAPGAAFVNGNSTGRFLFCPTGMDLSNTGTNPNLTINVAQRTATTCFMKGFSEHLRIQTSSGLPWFHRRICFTSKNTLFNNNPVGTTPWTNCLEVSSGMQRLMFNMGLNNMAGAISNFEGVIFKGLEGQDWNDSLIAPVDTSRVTLKFDKTWTIKSGNQAGTVVERKLWHPMNKNLVYDDDEAGSGETTSFYSVTSKAGMGDYYVYDIISPGIGGGAVDQCVINPNSTMYWHER